MDWGAIVTRLASGSATLVSLLKQDFRDHIYDNRYILHPRRLDALATEESEAFLQFLGGSDERPVVNRGGLLAREGVGESTVLSLLSALHRFCDEALPALPADLLLPVRERTNLYLQRLLDGYMRAREEQLLKDQEQLRKALSAALESQSRELLVKNHAINTSINAIVLADLDARVTWVNATFLSMWGYQEARQVIGSHLLEYWTGEEARGALDNLPRTAGWRGEFAARRRDGSAVSVEVSASLIRNESGTAIGIMTSFVDITERRRLQTQVLQAQKMDALGQLAGGIAHDFNNLLTAISGYLQLLLIDAPRDTQMHQDLMQIKAAVDRGTGLTRQLRFFTRQATGKRQITVLNDLARETTEMLKRTFPPEIGIELALAANLDPIEADPNQISQVMVNLCVNARDAMMDRSRKSPGGTLTVETANVELSAEQASHFMGASSGRYVLLRVRDTGIGMPPELLEKMFIPFFTTKSARSGTGLGLAVVYGIVANHRGFIDVRSTVDKGSTFEIYLPRADHGEAGMPAPPSVSSLAKGQGTVLVVEDEQQVREVMSRALAACGYQVISASDGREALARYDSGHKVDLVVLDMVMPGMGGRECMESLLKINPKVRVLVTTGYTSDGSANDLLTAGAIAILEKPLDLKVFAETVQRTIGTRDTRCVEE